jgi:hypothetical protein
VGLKTIAKIAVQMVPVGTQVTLARWPPATSTVSFALRHQSILRNTSCVPGVTWKLS